MRCLDYYILDNHEHIAFHDDVLFHASGIRQRETSPQSHRQITGSG